MEQSWIGAHPARAGSVPGWNAKPVSGRLKLMPRHSSPLLKPLRNPMHTHLIYDKVPAGSEPLLDDGLI